MNADRFPDDWLPKLARRGDERADRVVRELADRLAAEREAPQGDDEADAEGDQQVHSLDTRSSVFPLLLRAIARDTEDTALDDGVKRLLLGGGDQSGADDADGDIGAAIDDDLVRHAQCFFEEHGLPVITALFHAALPEAYLGRRGVQVLDRTGELVSNWTRRIQETGQFLVNVLSPTPATLPDDKPSLSPGQPGAVAVRRVRLAHAAVRWLLDAPAPHRFEPLTLRNLPEDRRPNVWEERLIHIGGERRDNGIHEFDSVALNQEDLLATLGTFTTVTLNALEKLAVRVDDRDREAFHHLWNVVGWHLGIGDSMALRGRPTGGQDPRAEADLRPPGPTPTWPSNRILPIGADEMDDLYRRLSARLQGPTTQGRRLAKALTRELALPLPRPLHGAPAVIVRYMIGDTKADMLEIEKGGYTELLTVRTGALEWVARRGGRVPVGALGVSLISQMLTRYAVRAFVARARGRERGLRIDPGIVAGWGVQTGPEVLAP
jgi:hypothetical protein